MDKADILEPYKTLLAISVLRSVREYYRDPEHRKEFEDWYLEEYGERYVWKTYGSIFNERGEIK